MSFFWTKSLSNRTKHHTCACLPGALLALSVTIVGTCLAHGQQSWDPVGPDGGDARTIAAEPGQTSHLYLGTTNSLIYESTDEGASWRRLSRLDSENDLVIDHILFDPRNPHTMYAAAWKFDRADGGTWISHDAGKSWQEIPGLHGQSVRALAQAPSDPRILVAGTLRGVFQSKDAGATWAQISPVGSSEIHEVESIAIDPVNPKIVYAGTWHLPWKTSDGGANWESIKDGLIVDSDVFSIILDPQQSNIVYLSACSGIYKSENAAVLFHKIQGIPSTARRTRVLRQDPVHHDTVYAGTTEGLYKTTDAGHTFTRMTGPDVIVNDVYVDPSNPQRVLLATDRSGVLSSENAAVSFEPANRGYSARKVQALLVDRQDPSRIYAGVVNDKTYGGVFLSADGGTQWKQLADGLDGRDIFALAQSPEGTVLAGTNSGIFALEEGAWDSRNTIVNTTTKRVTKVVKGRHVTVEKKVKEPARELDGRVHALDLSGPAWVAAATGGLFTSKDKGATWQGGPVSGQGDFISVTARDTTLAAASPKGVVVSADAGETWSPVTVPTAVTRIHRLAFSADGALWLGTREGLYYSRDNGQTWLSSRLPLGDVTDIYYVPQQDTLLVSSRGSDFVYAIDARTLNWKWHRAGYNLVLVRSAGGRLLAASPDDGVLAGPRPDNNQISLR